MVGHELQPSTITGSSQSPSPGFGLQAALFLLLFLALGVATAALLHREGNLKVAPVALVCGFLLLALERLEAAYLRAPVPEWKPLRGYLAPALIISVAAFTIFLPTLNSYFLGDDFGYVRLFYKQPWSHLRQLFYTDLSQGIWGGALEELRPFVGLSFWFNSHVSGIHAMGYHLMAIFQHVLSSLLVFLIVKDLAGGSSWRAVFAGLLFALLPVHAETVSWISGSKSDGLATLLYLAAFLGFLRFRITGRAAYRMVSLAAFGGSLLTKEIGITLPLVIFCYDVFWRAQKNGRPAGEGRRKNEPFRTLVFTHAPFAGLLLAYLGLRRIAFHSVLKQARWTSDSWPAFQSLQDFNFRQLLLPFQAILQDRPIRTHETTTVIALGLVLGIYLAWTVSLLRGRAACGGSLAYILFFGPFWYLVNNAPLVVTYPSARHLYVCAAGPCVALAFLVLPVSGGNRGQAGYLRLLTALFLISLSAFGLSKQNAAWADAGAISEKVRASFAADLAVMPQGSLVIAAAWGYHDAMVWNWALPYALQEPFNSRDLYSRVQIIEFADLYCCPLPQWWAKTKQALVSTLAADPNGEIVMHLLAWDSSSRSVQWKKRVTARRSLQARVEQALGRPLEAVESVDHDSAQRLVISLTEFVEKGS